MIDYRCTHRRVVDPYMFPHRSAICTCCMKEQNSKPKAETLDKTPLEVRWYNQSLVKELGNQTLHGSIVVKYG